MVSTNHDNPVCPTIIFRQILKFSIRGNAGFEIHYFILEVVALHPWVNMFDLQR